MVATTAKRSIQDILQNQEYAGEQRARYNHAQVINAFGMVGVETTPNSETGIAIVDDSEFDVQRALANGWEVITNRVGKGKTAKDIEFIATNKPRFHPVSSRILNAYDEQGNKEFKNGKPVLHTQLLVVFVDADNEPLHEGALTLKLKGGSVAAGSFYDVHGNYKKNKSCWLSQVWNVFPSAKGALLAQMIFECEMDTKENTAQGTVSARFTNLTPITLANVENCEMSIALGYGDDELNPIVELYNDAATFRKRPTRNDETETTPAPEAELDEDSDY